MFVICFVHLICITVLYFFSSSFSSRFVKLKKKNQIGTKKNMGKKLQHFLRQLISINQISKFFDYISHHLIKLYTRWNCSICNRHLFPFDIVKCVDPLLLKDFPLGVIVTHVLNQLRHVNESIPSIHHVLNNEFNESNLTLRY
jgi:hypothetical protein